jgi:hypothetical protein
MCLYTGFGLEIELTDQLQIVTTSNYSANVNSHTLISALQHKQRLLSLLCFERVLLGNGFQRRTIPLLWVPERSPCLSSQRLKISGSVTHSLTHQPTLHSLHCTALLSLTNWNAVALLLFNCRLLVICCLAFGVVYSYYLAAGLHATIKWLHCDSLTTTSIKKSIKVEC